MLGLQRAISLLYPDQCLLCNEVVERAGGLCAGCWREMPFIHGAICDACGVALPGTDASTGLACDECMQMDRPWRRGRAVFQYSGAARRLVLSLKHGDRPELAVPAAEWMARAGRDLLGEAVVLVPVPSHWRRLLRRRYNQSAEMAREISKIVGCTYCPDALVRVRSTCVQEGLGFGARFANVAGSIAPHPKRGACLRDAEVCIIDDVLTSGATLSEATAACLEAGARRVSVLALARVHKSP